MATVTHQLEMSGPTPTTDEVSWTVPGGVDAITICAIGSEIRMCNATGMAEPFTLPAHEAIVMTAYMIATETWYFTGLKSARLGIIYHT